MRLLSRWQNSAGERVRIALRLKGLQFDYVPVSSLAPGDYKALNPQGLLPALDVGGRIVAQSPAILEYLEEVYPEPSLLPSDTIIRAEARAFAAHITSEMHAITVQRVRRFLEADLAVDQTGIDRWVQHWLGLGFAALEETLRRRVVNWPFCFGDEPGWVDLHLVPQMGNARRLGCDLSSYPLLGSIEQRCSRLDAFRLSRPEAQPDFPHGQAPA
ncbi:maleylacetoacetate isomerase [Mesorhizobium hawassense]|uniref:Maleylacetoacetate isomerase n=1 Tax=Mesorhizobium hawassense TaxID=1209954 RepID=A0A330HWG6_9HYPH|nr:maleylacetoacetate isomerase [Mesorhizobium hawassense]RAZ92991.1 maleylacetoacetate isomerase [Mesorhizobium hawassense]